MLAAILFMIGGLLMGLGVRGALQNPKHAALRAAVTVARARATAARKEAEVARSNAQAERVKSNRQHAELSNQLTAALKLAAGARTRSEPTPAPPVSRTASQATAQVAVSASPVASDDADAQASPLYRFLAWWHMSRPDRYSIDELLRQQPVPGLRLQPLKSQAPFVAIRTTPPLFPGFDVLVLPEMSTTTHGMDGLFTLEGQIGHAVKQVIEPARVSFENYRPGMTDRLLNLGLQKGRLS